MNGLFYVLETVKTVSHLNTIQIGKVKCIASLGSICISNLMEEIIHEYIICILYIGVKSKVKSTKLRPLNCDWATFFLLNRTATRKP